LTISPFFNSRTPVIRSLKLALVLSSMLVPVVALGGQSPTPGSPERSNPGPTAIADPAGDTVSRKAYEIPALPLAEALDVYRTQSALQVEAERALMAGLRSHAVAGTYTAAQALRQLLEGTGLTTEFTTVHSVVLRRDPIGDRVATAPRLERIQVVARRSGYAASRTSTATKTPTPLRDVPQAVTVVTRQLVQDQAMLGMADVVRYVPGVTMGQGEGNRDQPTIRGNATTADFFVDGVRDDAQYYRDLYNLERVEALKGSNAMVFGRGGGGGVLNRVTKEAEWTRLRELTLQGGSFDHRRAALDVGQGLTDAVAARLNGVYEHSGLFRDGVTLRRYGVNPTVTFAPGAKRTNVVVGYERFLDRRTTDRGVPSFAGAPIRTDMSTFFGNPGLSYSDARVDAAAATLTHETHAGLVVRNRARYASYDKIYQNVFPGAVNAAGTEVSLSAYNLATVRRNLFNQTDVTYGLTTGAARHTLLLGAEVGHQTTDSRRETGFFNNAATTLSAPVAQPTVSTPVTFRQSATDADNHVTAGVASLYVQDKVALSPQWQLVAGLRYEAFDVRYRNNRTDSTLRRSDRMLSPRAGLVFKPAEPLSLYAGYSVSYLPSAGDQFSSLTDVTKELEPERFGNAEIGAKWDVGDRLAVTGAVYRLDRTNTRAPDPVDPTRTVQTGRQRTSGYELGVSGTVSPVWSIAGGYTNQGAVITSTTAAAKAGATVPLVPRTTVSLWNRVQLAPVVGLGLGVVHRGPMYAAIDNAVTVPGYTELDGAVFLALGRNVRAQVNVENLFDTHYYATAHSNNNITPGSPRAVRVSLTTGF
jgi:catecholate siderophore receptor